MYQVKFMKIILVNNSYMFIENWKCNKLYVYGVNLGHEDLFDHEIYIFIINMGI